MLKLYVVDKKEIVPISIEKAKDCISQLVWVDLLNPTSDEEYLVENMLATSIPTRDEMYEIELSSRLYQKDGVMYATATILTKADTLQPEMHAITFVLSGKCLITIRYFDSQPFKIFLGRDSQIDADSYRGSTVLAGLMEAMVDRLADILENIGHGIDDMTKKIFHPHLHSMDARAKEEAELDQMLRQVGIKGDLISKTRESMISTNRLLVFILQTSYFKQDSEEHNRVQSILRDIQALSDHASFLSNKTTFLLEAILGMISIEQNATIKIFSVVAVVLLPPTLVASVYGMNFDIMPELKWSYGYPFTLLLMMLSAYLPYKYFKKRRWL